MGNSKIIYNKNTLIDLTGDTVTADSLLSGVTAHNKAGDTVTGNIILQNFRTGTLEPSNSLGQNGDWYLVTEV